MSAVPVHASPKTKFIPGEKRSAPVIPRQSIGPEFTPAKSASSPSARYWSRSFWKWRRARGRREFLQPGLKDAGRVFLQPGQECRIYVSDGNKGDLPVCCPTTDGALIWFILSGIIAGI
jgi:hypothetical protein